MRHAEPFEIRAPAEGAAQNWSLADRVDLDVDGDSEECDFFRLIFNIRGVYDIPDAELIKLTESVEHALIERDNRFPSVRYADAV